MILVDMNQITIASVMMHLNMTKQKTVDEDMVRHMILNSVRLYRNMFNIVILRCSEAIVHKQLDIEND